jgi:hypothetical protein
MFQPIRYVGLDVSKETIAVAVAEPDGTVVEYGDIPNDPSSVRRLVEKLSRDAQLKTAYEAGTPATPCTASSPASASKTRWWRLR